MAFPSDTGTRTDDLEGAWRRARRVAATVKERSNAIRTLSAAGTLDASTLLSYSVLLADAKVDLERCAAVPGIAAYAQSQVSDPTLDVVAEFSSMLSAVTATINWIVTNFPKSPSGFAEAYTLLATGRYSARVFAAAQTATLRTQLDSLIATID